MSSLSKWLTAGAVVVAGLFSTAFAFPHVLDQLQSDTKARDTLTDNGDQGNVTPDVPSGPSSRQTPAAGNRTPSGGGLSVPTNPPVQTRHRPRVVSGAS